MKLSGGFWPNVRRPFRHAGSVNGPGLWWVVRNTTPRLPPALAPAWISTCPLTAGQTKLEFSLPAR